MRHRVDRTRIGRPRRGLGPTLFHRQMMAVASHRYVRRHARRLAGPDVGFAVVTVIGQYRLGSFKWSWEFFQRL